jgi:Flp pilus assembly protein TadD
MSNRGRKGNTQRGAGPRLSNAPAFAASARAANSETPAPPPVAGPLESSAPPPQVVANEPSADSPVASVPQPVVLETVESSSVGVNDDEPPPSSTRSRQAAMTEKVAAKESKPRTDKPKRAERRSKDRGKGARSSAAPAGPARGASRAPPSLAPPLLPSVAPSMPPSSGPLAADLADRFFEEGVKSEQGIDKPRLGAAMVQEAPEDEATDLKILHKMQPEVLARRAKYVRYVTIVSAGCMLLVLAGLVRHKIARGDQEVAARDMAAYAATHSPENLPIENAAPMAPPPSAPAVAPVEPSPSATAVAAASAAPDVAPSGQVPAANVAAAGETDVKPDAPAAVSPPPATGKTAAQEKRDCQGFLDRGAFGKAAEAGERSVALDPTDGEAWLLLGAAYQSIGRGGDARRAFNACLKEGKKGPLGECRAMLR